LSLAAIGDKALYALGPFCNSESSGIQIGRYDAGSDDWVSLPESQAGLIAFDDSIVVWSNQEAVRFEPSKEEWAVVPGLTPPVESKATVRFSTAVSTNAGLTVVAELVDADRRVEFRHAVLVDDQ
jgi:hypothetical protein